MMFTFIKDIKTIAEYLAGNLLCCIYKG